MDSSAFLHVAQADTPLGVLSSMANRHGLICGATGTGKTVTLRVLAEAFSQIGVPVCLADVKGDLASLCQPGDGDERCQERARRLGLQDYAPAGFPVTFWDVWGERGHPVRTTVSEMGPLLMSRLLRLNETQGGVLHLAFRVADDEGLLLLDLKDLRAMITHVGERAQELRTRYGNVSPASVGAIQRQLLEFEAQGAERLFGEPALQLEDMLQTASDGRGMINILVADRLMQSPRTYATLLLWMLSELFENLPEVGDLEKPRLVFFFDEAHLFFDDTPGVLVDKFEQVCRLIRSKGVGVYCITQSPSDLPETVLGQLGNRVQHALRAYTPREQKQVRAAADSFRPNPHFDTAQAMLGLGTGEALVSFLDAGGAPGVVERAMILPPRSRLNVLTEAERRLIMQQSLVAGYYERAVDRESAYEILSARQQAAASAALRQEAQPERMPSRYRGSGGTGQSMVEAFAKSALRSIGADIGRRVVRGILGSLLK